MKGAAALALAEKLGWHVFPTHWLEGETCSCGRTECRTDVPGAPAGKHPRTPNGFKDATTDPRVIAAWWEATPEANIGVRTGEASGIFVVDVDPKHGGDRVWDEWQLEHGYPSGGADLTTLRARTRSGGEHWFFRYEEGVRNRNAWLEGVDVRGEGGYVLVAPSQGYRWLTRGVGPQEAPEALLTAVKTGGVKAPLPDVTAGEVIPEGQRDETIFRLSCQLIRKLLNAGMSKEEAVSVTWARMQVVNAAQCKPPLPEELVTLKVQSASAQNYDSVGLVSSWAGNVGVSPPENVAQGSEGEEGGRAAEGAEEPLPLSDLGNALRLVNAYGDYVRFVPEWKWMLWDGKVWQADYDGVAMTRLATSLPDLVRQEGERVSQDDDELQRFASWAHASGMTARVDAALKLARADVRIAARTEHWDRELLHLAVSNGTVNLRTGELWPHVPEDGSTFCSDVEYDPGAEDERWGAFLKQCTGGDWELERFLQRAVGYTLTGVTDSEAFFLISGPAKTGKTTFIEAVQAMMGPYADTTNVTTFLHAKLSNDKQYEIAKMRGTRLLYVDELPETARLNENLVKQITSGGQLQGRHVYGRPFTFTPSAKVWFATNHAPSIYDDAIWRRVNKIAFTNVIDVPDVTIKQHLRTAARSAVLRWAVEGAMDWLARGRRLDPPESVKSATEEYKEDNDKMGQFIEDCLVLEPGATSTVKLLYSAYEAWTVEAGEFKVGRNVFMKKLKERNLPIEVHKRAKIDGRPELPVSGVRVVELEAWTKWASGVSCTEL
jgi:putative DNA primase/helicase